MSSEVQKPPARKHKVIADIQSGLVLIAPLDTPPEEDDEPPSGEVDPN
jgi:hypothetical protein